MKALLKYQFLLGIRVAEITDLGKAFLSQHIYIYRDFLQRLFYCDIKNVTVKLRIYFSIYTKDCGAAEMPYSASVLGVSNFCSSPNW